MAVGIGVPRDGIVVTWERGDYVGPVIVRATNVENGDVGIAKSENDGEVLLTWPPGTWTDAIVIYKDEPTPIEPVDPPVVDNTLPEVPRPVDPWYGVDVDTGPVRPDNTLPGDLPTPEHPIVLPDPDDPHVEHHLVGVIDYGEITVTIE